ncbi:ABC transporter substrate-binding protein [Actinoplanes solisilvae]|uniref:ABC transporter substrate-binding protein n=1 Tax=Actinoplanes solisilvae TaxID=2486853 RepID=UPI000FDC044B|nr:ABC transporter substrate-binding protein [Actinoplanes solisilvae]
MPPSRCLVRGAFAGTLALVLVPAAACTKSAAEEAEPEAGSSAAQQVQATSGAGSCTPEKYNSGVPALDLKTVTVGFAQSEKEANPFRITETQSIKDEAAKRGIKLITTNAQSDLNKEIADIQGMIAQGAKALIISPLNSEGLDPALTAAKDAKVPVMTIDRLLTTKTPCVDYLGWIGSDFVVQGRRAADAMIKATGDQGEVAILLGASGVNVTVDRTKGFKDQLVAKNSQLKIVAEQTGDFTREKGQKVTEQLISANPGIGAIYAENDEMALGAVAALKAAGKKAGDVKIITIDGTKGAVQGILDGWIAGVIESNPRFGPLAFQALEDFYSGKGVVEKTIISDKEYTPENARSELANAY